MTLRFSHGLESPRATARIILYSLCLAAPVVAGCSDSTSLPKDTVTGTKPGSSLAPGGEIKPNITPSKASATAEPL